MKLGSKVDDKKLIIPSPQSKITKLAVVLKLPCPLEKRKHRVRMKMVKYSFPAIFVLRRLFTLTLFSFLMTTNQRKSHLNVNFCEVINSSIL